MHSKLLRRILIAFILPLLFLPAAFAKCPLAVIGKNKIKLEVAQTEQQIAHGLMERASMPEEQGMVFIFRPPHPVRFWMFNCLMSLDMIFIKDGKIVKIARDVPPYKLPDPRKAPLYPAEGEVDVSEVVEVNAGYCARHGIKDGDTVKFDLPGIAAGNTGESSAAPPAGSESAGAGTDTAAGSNH